MASCSTSALSDEVMWEELPEELLRRVLEHVMLRRWKRRWCGAVRGVSRRWRAVHDAACQWLSAADGITDEGMHALCERLPALTHLNLNEVTSLTEDGLRAVGGLATLNELYLSGIHVTNAVLWELRGQTALTTLYLHGGAHVTDVGLQHLSSLTALTTLDLSDTHVTDVGIQHLSSLTALTTLGLDYCTHVTEVGLQHLSSLTALTELHLYDCNQVTDAGLQHLSSLTALTELTLGGTSTTQAGQAALEAALPALHIWW
jgi:F-box/leucine-rich repeat protein 14